MLPKAVTLEGKPAVHVWSDTGKSECWYGFDTMKEAREAARQMRLPCDLCGKRGSSRQTTYRGVLCSDCELD